MAIHHLRPPWRNRTKPLQYFGGGGRRGRRPGGVPRHSQNGLITSIGKGSEGSMIRSMGHRAYFFLINRLQSPPDSAGSPPHSNLGRSQPQLLRRLESSQ